MADKSPFGLVGWYISAHGVDFRSWVAKNKRDEIAEASVDDFFDKIIKTAANKAPTASRASSLKALKQNSKFKNVSISQILSEGTFQDRANEYFDTLLKDRINKSSLPRDRKEGLIGSVSQFEDIDQLESAIRSEEEAVKEEIRIAQEKARQEAERKARAKEEAKQRLEEVKKREEEAKKAEEFLQARKEREELSKRSAAQARRRELERALGAIPE